MSYIFDILVKENNNNLPVPAGRAAPAYNRIQGLRLPILAASERATVAMQTTGWTVAAGKIILRHCAKDDLNAVVPTPVFDRRTPPCQRRDLLFRASGSEELTWRQSSASAGSSAVMPAERSDFEPQG